VCPGLEVDQLGSDLIDCTQHGIERITSILAPCHGGMNSEFDDSA